MPQKTNNPEKTKNRKWYDLECGFCEAVAEESNEGRRNGVISGGR